ncbi:hypothetical protein TNCT_213521 [Trichonephila clavata]|uniref:Uncharacterized protein n=1 Tax=Trichonephila clavata TaxID=2740835 RepID=A0A8X6LY89_TRICU|nr:hypothetical protein TNCT_213521 [Trichonephila clavata]
MTDYTAAFETVEQSVFGVNEPPAQSRESIRVFFNGRGCLRKGNDLLRAKIAHYLRAGGVFQTIKGEGVKSCRKWKEVTNDLREESELLSFSTPLFDITHKEKKLNLY